MNRQIGVGAVKLSERAKRYVNIVLDSERLSYGPFSQKFEKELARIHGCRHGIFVNSGTSALQIAVAALKEKYKWQDGDEIIVPAVTFVASSNVIIQNNLKPVFADVHDKYYNLNPKKVEESITGRTRAIMAVHLFGQPCDMDAIIEIAKKHDLRIIEDSCETMFAKYKGKPVGCLGDIACFSTYACHLLVTGVGGMAVTNDDEIAVMLRSLANHGRDSIYLSIDDDKGKKGKELGMVMERRFSFVRMGYSYRATEMEAALGLAQLEEWEEMISKRRSVAERLISGLKKHEPKIQLPEIMPDTEHSFMMLPIVVKDPAISRESLTLHLEENGIETRHMLPLLNQPFYKDLFGNMDEKHPIAADINLNGFYIGSHPEIGEEEIQHIHKMFDQFFWE